MTKKRYEVLSWEELEDRYPEEAGDYTSWRAEHRYLVDHARGVVVYSDGGEPEDQTFDRDWGWVEGELNKAYADGYDDGKREGR